MKDIIEKQLGLAVKSSDDFTLDLGCDTLDLTSICMDINIKYNVNMLPSDLTTIGSAQAELRRLLVL